MRIGIDRALYPLLFGQRPPAPVHVEPPGAGIDFDDRAGLGGRLDDCGDVHPIGITGEQETAREMPHHRDMRIANRADDPLGHGLLIGRKSRVNRRDDIVERQEHLVGKIEITLLEDVAFRPREEPESRLLKFPGGIELADLGNLFGKACGIEPACLKGALAVVGDTEVLEPQIDRGTGHLDQ